MDDAIKIVGIAGMPRSGKDTLAAVFIEAGYFGVSLGDIVRDISRVRYADTPDPISIAHMTETSNSLRAEKGADFALHEALSRYHQAQATGGNFVGLVVYSVRAPIEADFILKRGGSLIWLETNDALRHERAMHFMRDGETAVSLEEFQRQEAQQWQPQPGLDEKVQMNLSYVKQRANHILQNDSDDLSLFADKASALLASIN